MSETRDDLLQGEASHLSVHSVHSTHQHAAIAGTLMLMLFLNAFKFPPPRLGTELNIAPN